jgi:hypothetical protein
MSLRPWLPLLFVVVACARAEPAPCAPALADLARNAQAEVAAMEAVLATEKATAERLEGLRRAFIERAYFLRVPAAPALDALESDLRRLGTRRVLVTERCERHVPNPPPLPRVTLKAGQQWRPTRAELLGTAKVDLSLKGRAEDVADFVDELPQAVERLVVVTSAQRLGEEAFVLNLEAYYELPLPAPGLALTWPPLDQRLRAIGCPPGGAAAGSPEGARLQAAIARGGPLLPRVHRTLQAGAELARWRLRAEVFAERSQAALAVRGRPLLGLPAPTAPRRDVLAPDPLPAPRPPPDPTAGRL